MLRRGVRRLAGGGVEVRLGSVERDALASLAGELVAVLRGEADIEAGGGSVRARLFPAAYEDPLQELEFRELMGGETEELRAGALEAFAETLERGSRSGRAWSVTLTAEEADAWLSAVNDGRLTLGMIAGVDSEQDWEQVHARGDTTAVLLAYLGWLQEELVAALMGGLPED